MPIKHAKVLDDKQFARLMNKVEQGKHGARDRVMVLLSYKAGLRAQEIAGLEWSAVTDADGEIVQPQGNMLIGAHIAKKGHARDVPMHPDLYRALMQLREQRPNDRYVSYAATAERMTPNHITVWFHGLYSAMQFHGCSSHSGRRTFITRLARRANLHDCSIKDVQILAGHKRLETTEAYLEASPSVHRLIAAI